jgi:hypothetical protein
MADQLITIGFLMTAGGVLFLFAARIASGRGLFPLSYSIEREFAAYKQTINQMIAREDAVLRSLGITPPQMISECGYQTEKRGPAKETFYYVTLIPPCFEYPLHRKFIIKSSGSAENGIVATLTKNIEAAWSSYRWWGLGDAVSEKLDAGCVWTCRDPYAFYRGLEKKPFGQIYCNRSGDFTKSVQSDSSHDRDSSFSHRIHYLPPLGSVPALSVEEASNVHMRVQIYNYATDGEHSFLRNPKTFYGEDYNASWRIPDEILFQLPIACTWINDRYKCLKVYPAGETKPERMIEFLNSLHSINHFIIFELIRGRETVYFRLRFPSACERQIIEKLNLLFPGFEAVEGVSCESGKQSFNNWLRKTSLYQPIRRLNEFHLDPYSHIASVFDNYNNFNNYSSFNNFDNTNSDKANSGNTNSEKLLCYQVMFAPLTNKAAASLKRHLTERAVYETNYADQFAKKLPLWLVSFNLCGTDETEAKALTGEASRVLDSGDRSFSEPISYKISNGNFPQMFPAFLSLMETEELATLAHFPISPLPIERLETVSVKNVKPPETYTNGDTRIGQTKMRARNQLPVTLPDEVRERHVYIVGKSGTGKSTLIETLARRDIEAGRGIAVIDPHGDMIHHLLETMPEHRAQDCILFSPKLCPVSLEILTAENEHEIDLLSDDLITMFRRTSESWGDKMQAILQMAFQTLLRVPGSSFTDITPLLTDESYRNRLLSKIDHPQLASFWQNRYDARQAEPILIRMDRLTTSGVLRQVLTQNSKSLNFYDVITESKIFLADLSKGFLGESTSHLLGSIIVSQIQLAAMRQAHLPIEQRIPFSLFVDEVQNFTTSAFSTILSEARKQKLRLTIAHQFVSQLPQEIQKAVFGNVGTMMFFAMSPDDLGAARHELGTFEPIDVANLPKYHALCRPATAAKDTFVFMTDPPPTAPKNNYAQSIIERTRREYGTTEAAPASSHSFSAAVSNQVAPGIKTPSLTTKERQYEQPESVFTLPNRRPEPAVPLSFSTNTEKIMHFLRKAEYLSQPQIIALTDLLPPNASTALKKLVESGQIKSLDDRRPKIYFIGRTCNPTVHNLLVRDLFVKINASNYAIRSVKFNDVLSDLNPDLSIEFVAKENNSLTPLPAYFELDRGTEGVQELVKKADRYARLSNNPLVGFIFERESDMHLARKTIKLPFILYATLDQFSTLKDESFYTGGTAPADGIKLPFFGS